MKPVRIICPSALAALTLTSVLGQEGHEAVWAVFEREPVVLTNAPIPAVLAACDTASTMWAVRRDS